MTLGRKKSWQADSQLIKSQRFTRSWNLDGVIVVPIKRPARKAILEPGIPTESLSIREPTVIACIAQQRGVVVSIVQSHDARATCDFE